MKRMHVMLKVRDLEGSVDFYRELFGAEPTVRKDDYAKWMLEDPRVNFSLGVAAEGTAPGIEHLGIQAETAEELEQLRQRIRRLEAAAGATVDDEGETTCCYANSDKTWVVDGQGVAWEAFHSHGTAPTYYSAQGETGATGRGAACCAPQPAAEPCCDEASRPAVAAETACC